MTEGGRTTVYHYDLASRAVAQTQPNGLWQYSAYDDLGRLESRQTYTSADALQAQFLWTYDAVGNVTVQSERWPGEGTRGAGWRSTVMVYDATNRLTGEAMAQPGSPVITTGYAYDTGSNRSVKLVSTDGSLTTQTLYTYNHFNQLTDWSEEDGLGAVTRTADLTYDLAGNRATQTLTVTGQSAQTTTYHWDAENRLESVTLPNADEHEYGYDYRTRRISRVENGIGTAIVYSGGLSVAEYESQGITPTVEYLRGPDMGGGVGGMMYSLRNGGTEAKYAMSNGRGDVVAQSNDAGALTWTASYEAYGKRPVETGANLDRQRANTKEEDPTGLLNEGFRYRDIETGVWLSRDPAGFVDGPNLYTYVRQNPWTSFDPLGLDDATPLGKIKVGEVYTGLDIENTGKGYVGSAWGENQTALGRVMDSGHKFRPIAKSGAPVEVRPVYVDELDFERAKGIFGGESSARNNLVRYAERAVFLEASESYPGVEFLNTDKTISSGENRRKIETNGIAVSMGESSVYKRGGGMLGLGAEWQRQTPRSKWFQKASDAMSNLSQIDSNGRIRTSGALGAFSLGLLYFNRDSIANEMTHSFESVLHAMQTRQSDSIMTTGTMFAQSLPGANDLTVGMAIQYMEKLAYAIDPANSGRPSWK